MISSRVLGARRESEAYIGAVDSSRMGLGGAECVGLGQGCHSLAHRGRPFILTASIAHRCRPFVSMKSGLAFFQVFATDYLLQLYKNMISKINFLYCVTY